MENCNFFLSLILHGCNVYRLVLIKTDLNANPFLYSFTVIYIVYGKLFRDHLLCICYLLTWMLFFVFHFFFFFVLSPRWYCVVFCINVLFLDYFLEGRLECHFVLYKSSKFMFSLAFSHICLKQWRSNKKNCNWEFS